MASNAELKAKVDGLTATVEKSGAEITDLKSKYETNQADLAKALADLEAAVGNDADKAELEAAIDRAKTAAEANDALITDLSAPEQPAEPEVPEQPAEPEVPSDPNAPADPNAPQ